MSVLILGQGGREHAIAWKCLESPFCEKAYVLPGNAGMSLTENLTCLKGDPSNIDLIKNYVKKYLIKLVIIGPENLLEKGIVDLCQSKDILVLGPTQKATQLESSKIFSKTFMKQHHIPTAPFVVCHDYQSACDALNDWEIPPVIKLSSLAAGKGVFIPETKTEAKKILHDLFINPNFSLKTKMVLLESRLYGQELSAFILSDGEHFINIGYARDYKRLLANNQGPNTGGMGCYSDWPSNKMQNKINSEVFKPTLLNMKTQGIPFKGILFAGLMITNTDDIQVLEFNTRLGDPETQTILPLIKNDFYQLCYDAALSQLNPNEIINLHPLKSVHVVMASGGYPGVKDPLSLGHHVQGIKKDKNITQSEKAFLFSAGIQLTENNHWTNQGGRVLGITGLGNTLSDARAIAYKEIESISFKDAYYRRDIACLEEA